MLPKHDELSWLTRAIEWLSIGVAGGLLCLQVWRIGDHVSLHWSLVALGALAGAVAADLVSGLIHWTADTWGSETMPILGRRFLRPFRVHHVNPDDFLRREFADTNGDVAMIVIPFLLLIFLIPLDVPTGQCAAIFLTSFCAVGAPTNQIHQWAHMPTPPRLVRWLQRLGLILSREAHKRHHRMPYAMNYCITTGWCNPILSRLDFFRRAERLITTCSGSVPRQDDTAFQQELQACERAER